MEGSFPSFASPQVDSAEKNDIVVRGSTVNTECGIMLLLVGVPKGGIP